MIIQTSELGYNISIYDVSTNASIQNIENIDKEFGTQNRFNSTTIQNLEKGALLKGFTFNFKILYDKITYNPDIKIDYKANFGNY